MKVLLRLVAMLGVGTDIRHYNRTRNAQLTAATAVLDSSRRGEIKPEWREFVEAEKR